MQTVLAVKIETSHVQLACFLEYISLFEYISCRDESNLETKIDSLAKEIISQTGSSWMTSAGPARPTIADQRPQELHNKVSRAFKHCLTGKFLAESGKNVFL